MKADYIQHMGTDLTVVNAARVSFGKQSSYDFDPINEVWCLNSADKKLIRFLSKHNHWTPFSHAQITVRETVPIFVARQRFKHMVGFTYNEVSRRYVDDEPEFFYPTWRKRADDKKQGSAEAFEAEYQEKFSARLRAFHDHCEAEYRWYLEQGVAPEQARMVLPQSMLTSYYVTGSLAAFARAYKLRNAPDAQVEIQVLAKEWDRIIGPLFPEAWAALVN